LNWKPIAGFAVLLAALWVAATYFGIDRQIGPHVFSAVVSAGVLLAPYWGFGFGLADWLRPRVQGRGFRFFVPLWLVTAYPIFAISRGEFRWEMLLGFAVMVLIPAIPNDAIALLIPAIAVEFHFFDRAWPMPGLNSLPKLMLLDSVLYAYLVLRPIGGMGFDWRTRISDWRIGVREFLFYTPIAIAAGFALQFLHWHATWASPLWFGSAWVFTFFFIAAPEEIFFRGLLLNLLDRKLGTRWALMTTSLLFGLAHFNKRAPLFNWRYVALATIAGLFYGRAWLARRRVAASAITHATVDTVWSIWLR
jgi:membrane protease YdiL (CAAX protease family)